jgi:mannose-1-phosphate guanylyltransferase/phosphomannomutase
VKAVIMAGGEGTRLRPLTSNHPKPMMPLVNRPMMEHIVDLLRRHGIDEIVVTVAYMANTIRNYFGDGSQFGVRMVYASEETPLGTAGSVRNAMDELSDDTFLVISGDVLTDVDLGAIVDFHRDRKALATIGLVRVENPLEFGIVITREDGSIERFLEKPSWGEVFTDTINTGIYVLEPKIFDWIPADAVLDFSSDVFPQLLEQGEAIFGAVAEGYWEDVGTLDAYVRAHQDILDGRVQVQIGGFEISDGVWVGEGAEVHPDASVVGPAVIGDNSIVDAGDRLGEYVVLGAGVRLGRDVSLARTVVGDNAYLGDAVQLRGTVVGKASDLRRGVRGEEGVVLGDEVFVGEDAVITTNVKVYPFKTVEARAINSSIIWETKGARSLFGRDGVVGLANVDMTPELATRVALALATHLPRGANVVISRDSSRSARMLKRAFMAGLNSGGVNVLDLEVASVPLTRFVSRLANVAAGITIRLTEESPDDVSIRFFGKGGADIPSEQQRKIERLFAREDFRRVRPADIGDIDLPPRALEQYAVSLESIIDIAAIADRHFKVVVDYGYGSVAHVMPNVLAKLRAEVLAVNPYASTAGMVDFDLASHAENVSKLVTASGAHLGAIIDPAGEVLTLIDDLGHVLSASEALYVMLDLVTDRLLGDTVALPVAASSKVADLLEARGFKVLWTGMGSAALAEAANEPGVGFAADLTGGFILPGFLPALDGSAAFLKVLDLLAIRQRPLSELVARAPEIHIVHDEVVTPWESKGVVMRSLVEQSKGREVVLVDGVKIHHDAGWALLLPDPHEPLTHIWAEGDTAADARAVAQEYSRRIRQMQR